MRFNLDKIFNKGNLKKVGTGVAVGVVMTGLNEKAFSQTNVPNTSNPDGKTIKKEEVKPAPAYNINPQNNISPYGKYKLDVAKDSAQQAEEKRKREAEEDERRERAKKDKDTYFGPGKGPDVMPAPKYTPPVPRPPSMKDEINRANESIGIVDS